MPRPVCLGIVVSFLIITSSLGQTSLRRSLSEARDKQPSKQPGEFTFVRTIYHSPFGGRQYASWAVDYPEADYHFIIGIRDWAGTNLNISSEPKQIAILDEELFSYPLIYFVEPGYLELSERGSAAVARICPARWFSFFGRLLGKL